MTIWQKLNRKLVKTTRSSRQLEKTLLTKPFSICRQWCTGNTSFGTWTSQLLSCTSVKPTRIGYIIDKRSSRPNLRKTISEPPTGIEPVAFWWPVRHSNHCATETWMAHRRASSTYVLPFGCRLCLRNRFSVVRAWRTVIDRRWYLEAFTSTTYVRLKIG